MLRVRANVVVISMAWLTHAAAEDFLGEPDEPDLDTLSYWVQRLEPLLRQKTGGGEEEEVMVVFANRCGIEGQVLYAGTSAVVGVRGGTVSVYGILGRGTEKLLVVDTARTRPVMKLALGGSGDDRGVEL